MADETSTDSIPLAYKNTSTGPTFGHRVAAAFCITVVGLGILVVGGCFLIGVLLTHSKNFNPFEPTKTVPPPLTSSEIGFITVMYVLALLAFVGGAIVIAVGVRWLVKILRT